MLQKSSNKMLQRGRGKLKSKISKVPEKTDTRIARRLKIENSRNT